MSNTPLFLGALILVAGAGALSGAAIGEAPILTSEVQASLPDAQPFAATDPLRGQSARPPDHYPLETPAGTIEVAELALHGRLRNTAHALWYREGRGSVGALDTTLPTDYGEEDLARLAREEALIAYTARPPQIRQPDLAEQGAAGEPQAPLAQADPAGPVVMLLAE